jgi:predicted MFS family arabinose efflux permease
LAYAVLAIPALLAIAVLIAARFLYPRPYELEAGPKEHAPGKPLPRVFWIYLSAVGLVAAGFADYPLIAFHIKTHTLFADPWIPLLYTVAMGIDALAALVFGRWYDKKGIRVLAFAVAASSLFAVFAFSLHPAMIMAGAVLWGIGMGAQESVIRAAVADMVPKERRGTGFGIFNAGYGIAWFMGSALMGFLYDRSMAALILFSVAAQWAALPILAAVHRRMVSVHSGR